MTVTQLRPVRLEVIAPSFQGLGICTSCELVLSEAGVGENPRERALHEYPQEWQDDGRRLTDWVYDLAGRYGERILIKVIDPQSPEGILKSLRYWVRRYPTFIVDGKRKVVGWEQQQLQVALACAFADQAEARTSGLSLYWERLRTLIHILGEMFYGMTIYEMVRDLHKERGMIERLFILVVFGDVLGVPLLPPYYALRLLPYVVPNIDGWRHSLLRERDLTDLCDQEIT